MYYCDICSTNGMEKLLSGKNTTNLTKHIKAVHAKIYCEEISPDYHFAMERLKKIQSFCEIVAVDGRPFNWLLTPGFLHSQEDDLNEISEAGLGITMNKNFDELKSYIKNVAVKIRDNIKAELKNIFVSLMLDIATRNYKSVLGISIQFVKDDKIEIRSLGIITLNKSHTAKYIAEMLMKCLDEFEIKIDRVISLTTDNARNMLAITEKLDEYVHQIADLNISTEPEPTEPNVPVFITDEPLNDSQMEEVLSAIADAEALNCILDDRENFDELFQAIMGNLPRTVISTITIRCGAHTTQLIVRHALKKCDLKQLLTLCRFVAKKLRVESYKISAEEANITFKLPHLSCDTRWDSDYYMVIYFIVF